ncbi:MAG: UbiA family prenyltransferase [Planctomycetes bacterium]|nr:UbiA family prenyltransferase [Planctomycetota bacterium]
MPLLLFLRFPGVFTAIADVLAGYLIVRFSGAGEGNTRALVFAILASCCLYMAGMAWNDVFDFEDDKKNRAERPLPIGALTLTGGFLIAVTLTFAGLLFSMAAGMNSFLVACALICAIFLYDGVLKKVEILGPISMGACRGLNLILGMTAHGFIVILLENPILYVPPIIVTLYIAIVTCLSSLEDPLPAFGSSIDEKIKEEQVPEYPSDVETVCEEISVERTGNMRAILSEESPVVAPESNVSPISELLASIVKIFCVIAMIIVPFVALYFMPHRPVSTGIFIVTALILVTGGIRVIKNGGHIPVRRMVGLGITCLILLNAGFVASLSSPRAVALPLFDRVFHVVSPTIEEFAGIFLVILLIIPTLILRKRISIT